MTQVQVKNSPVPALIDDIDFSTVAPYPWYLHDGYAYTKGPKGTFFMHQLLSGQKRIDHKDRNRLNNQRSNFRPATHQQNLRNAVWSNLVKTSKFKGVSWDSERKRWRACIVIGKRQKLIGRFKSETEAADAYDFSAQQLFGEFAVLNKNMKEHT